MTATKIKLITQSALTLAVCFVLGSIAFLRMPCGGSVTLAHTAPLFVYSFARDYKKGFYIGVIYGFLQIIMSFHIPPVKTFWSFALVILLDYIFPYALIGASSICSLIIKNKTFAFWSAMGFASFLRLFLSVISGVVIWKEYFPPRCDIIAYSIIYNCTYMIPDIIITFVMCAFFVRIFKSHIS